MWYVIWTSTGFEKKTENAVKEFSCQKRCFVPRRVLLMKRNGNWEKVEKPLFPGYFFVDTDDIEKLVIELCKVEGFNKVLTVDKEFIPLCGKDAELVERLSAKAGLFDMSEGIIEGDKIIVTKGPLMGQEGRIKKVDRHKRMAYLEFTMFNQVIHGTVGLEIVEKR
ncbi:MAG: antiterminator LoaP [Clostridiales bacterium]|nr:antiterminator LoaP [Clostridiales bacterium]